MPRTVNPHGRVRGHAPKPNVNSDPVARELSGGGRVKKRTLAKVSKLPQALIDDIDKLVIGGASASSITGER